MRLARQLVRQERETHAGLPHPGMWARGFLSGQLHHYPGVRDHGAAYVSDLALFTRLGRLNSAASKAVFADKVAFAAALCGRGLVGAAPEVYGEVVDGVFVPRAPDVAERLRTARVVVKPVRGSGPSALNTVRVLTVRLPDRGPVVAAAVHRFATRATGAVDNVSAGGLFSRVDLATGRLGPALTAPGRTGCRSSPTHPDTGHRIDGSVVPDWAEVCGLGLDLMRVFPDVDHVGWDLCVSDRGPLVLEGNADIPSLSLFQFAGPFLSDPDLRAWYADRGLLPRRWRPPAPRRGETVSGA